MHYGRVIIILLSDLIVRGKAQDKIFSFSVYYPQAACLIPFSQIPDGSGERAGLTVPNCLQELGRIW